MHVHAALTPGTASLIYYGGSIVLQQPPRFLFVLLFSPNYFKKTGLLGLSSRQFHIFLNADIALL